MQQTEDDRTLMTSSASCTFLNEPVYVYSNITYYNTVALL